MERSGYRDSARTWLMTYDGQLLPSRRSDTGWDCLYFSRLLGWFAGRLAPGCLDLAAAGQTGLDGGISFRFR